MAEYKKHYNPNRSPNWNYGGENWKLSRSKIDLFCECPRCFYLDNKLGTARPRGPAFTLNVAVDELFKKEFDQYRQKSEVHPLTKSYKLDAVPFQHPDLDKWRDNFTGIQHHHKATGFIISGAVDDIWINKNEELIVVDYKATSKDGEIISLSDSAWEKQYQRQIGVYQWLLVQNGFKVNETGYFVYANALRDNDSFSDTLQFKTTLVPCAGETDWIEPTLLAIKDCLVNEHYPKSGNDCEFCPYREAAGKKLLKIRREQM